MTIKETSHTLSDEKKEDLLSDQDTELQSFAQTMHNAKETAKKEKAWISAIVPPDTEHPEAPVRGKDEVAVKFLVRSGKTFWETYEVSESYLSEDNNFRQLINSTGYDINALQYAVGEPIDIVYNDRTNQVQVDPEIFGGEEDNGSSSVRDYIRGLHRRGSVGLYVRVLVFGLITAFLIVRTRGLAIIGISVVIILTILVRMLLNE